MYTDAELREALEHSAARADAITEVATAPAHDHVAVPIGAVPLDDAPSRRDRRWLRVGLPAAAAAAVIAVATVAVYAGRSGDSDQHAAAPPSKSVRAADRSLRTHHRADPHVGVDLTNAIDKVYVDPSAKAEYEIGGNGDAQVGSEGLRTSVKKVTSLQVAVVPAATSFDGSRIPRDHPVQIAGTTGYYSLLKLYPLDGGTGADSDKYLPHWTIAYRTAQQDWVFVYIEKAGSSDNPDSTDVSVNDPAAIVRSFDKAHVRFGSGTARLPFRTGYLPAGLSFGSAYQQTGYGDPGYTTVYLQDGAKSIEIDMLPSGTEGGGGISIRCPSTCPPPPPTASRKVGSYTLQVTGTGYDKATVQRIADTMKLPASIGDRSTYWSIADSLG